MGIVERLEANSILNLNTGCLEWQQTKDKDGYGSIHIKGKKKRVHRVVAELFLSDYSEKLQVRHFICDNPPCINPQHLKMGTNSDNQKDSRSKGCRINNNQWTNYISDEEVSDIKGYRKLGLTQQQIANIMGFSQSFISNTLKRG